MARGKQVVQKREEEEQEEFDNSEALATLTMSYEVAKLVFKTDKPSPEMVFGIHDQMDLEAESVEAAAEEFIAARDTAAELFGIVDAVPSPEIVFGVFERAFVELDEDENEDD